MANIFMLKITNLSVKELYDKYGNHLAFGSIEHTYEDGEEYYDLYDENGFLVCVDGQKCEVISINREEITLKNDNDKLFLLSREEFENAAVCIA